MKVHSDVDARRVYAHAVTVTVAGAYDINEAEHLIRKDETVIYGYSKYINAEKHMESLDADRLSTMEFQINVRLSSIKISRDYKDIRWDLEIEKRKSSTRCKVEHPFLIVKCQFGYCKAAYKGLAKKMCPFNILFACAHLLMRIRAGWMGAFYIGNLYTFPIKRIHHQKQSSSRLLRAKLRKTKC